MALQSFQLDPAAQSYTDDEIVGKVNSAAVAISRADAIAGAALGGCDSDNLTEGATNKYDTGVPPADTDELAEGASNKYDTGVPPTDTDELAEGVSNLYDTGAPPTDDEVVVAVNNASVSITREAALSQDDLMIIKTNPTTGEFQVKNIQRDAAGQLDVEYDDVPEP